MRRLVGLIGTVVLMLCAVPATAVNADALASESSVRELIAVTQAKKLMDDVLAQMDGLMRSSTQTQFAGKNFDAEQRKIAEETQVEMLAMLKDELSWEKMEPMFIDIYSKTFTQKEVDDLIVFYKTESGQSMIRKMPLVTQQSMQLMQGRMGSLMERMANIQKKVLEKYTKDSVKQ